MTQIIILGDSHTSALKRAISTETFSTNISVNFLFTRQEKYNPLVKDRKNPKINSSLKQDIDGFVKKEGKNHIITMLNGNYHAAISMCPSPDPKQRFDFISPKHKYLPNQPNTTIVPYKQIKLLLIKNMTNKCINPLLSIKKELPDFPIYSISPPPTIPSAEHIKKNTGIFKDRIEQYGISPAHFRLKFWWLQTEILQEICQQNGIIFIPTPKEAQNSEGFLLEKFWSIDPLHANALYGKLILDQIESIMGE